MQNITSNKTHLARGIATLMTVLFALWFFPAAARADNWQGVGTQGKPYLINSAADLETLSQKVAEVDNFSRGMYFQLGADIVLDKNWKPIGVNGGSANRAFQGTLDGKNHQITFAHGSPPLFGAVYADGNTGAVIKNLKIYGKYIAGNGLIEGFIRGNVDSPVIIDSVTLKSGTTVKKSGFLGENGGYVLTVEIKNCVAEKNVKIGWDAVKNAPTDHSADYIRGGSGVGAGVGSFVSGLCGTVANSKSAAMVYGQSNVGGIAGYKAQSIRDCSVISCQFSGEIVATGKNVGGILGAGYGEGLTGFWASPNAPAVNIKNCSVTGKITGGDRVGGILGAEPAILQTWDNGIGYIQNNHFGGTLNGKTMGGIVGYMQSLNRYNVIEGNTFAEDCGAKTAIGGAKYVDTSNISPTKIEGVVYVNSAVLTGIKGMSKVEHFRSDDPLGRDSDKLGRMLQTPAITTEKPSSTLQKNSSQETTVGSTATEVPEKNTANTSAASPSNEATATVTLKKNVPHANNDTSGIADNATTARTLPDTDDSSIVLWLALCVLSMVGAISIQVSGYKRDAGTTHNE